VNTDTLKIMEIFEQHINDIFEMNVSERKHRSEQIWKQTHDRHIWVELEKFGITSENADITIKWDGYTASVEIVPYETLVEIVLPITRDNKEGD